MRVSDEVDALRTIGLDPYRYLVLPRLIALALMLPDPDAASATPFAIAGGAMVGVASLDLTAHRLGAAETQLRARRLVRRARG